MKRSDLLQLLEAALAAGQPAYARDAAVLYLVDRPGDLAVQSVLARALAVEGSTARAADVLSGLLGADPEDAAAQRAFAEQQAMLGNPAAATHAQACAHVIDGAGADGPVPAWAVAAHAAMVAENTGDWATAQHESLAALRGEPPGPLASLIHLAALWHAGQLDLARPLAEGFHERWSTVVAFKLCLAETLLAAGERVRAIELLHEAAGLDQGGQVVARHWGQHHPYRSLWDSEITTALPGPVPASVAAAMGLNQLPAQAGQAHGGPHGDAVLLSPELAEIQARLDWVAARLPSRHSLKYRLNRMKQLPVSAAIGERAAPGASARPYYVILSSRTRLLQVFGNEAFVAIDGALHALQQNTQRRTGWQACKVYVDDPQSLSPFGLRPVNPTNAWDVKTLVGKLAARLKEQQSRLGALIIIGGPDIVPFHHLPNPTDDVDPDIPSDNPYATGDENYFVPEWPVGRLPSGAGSDAGPLLRLIRLASGPSLARSAHSLRAWVQRALHWLRQRWRARTSRASFGYSANVWKQASAAVYTQIGDPSELLTSPPLDANALPVEGLAPSRLSYFNLHGIEDGPEWYGQRGWDDPGTMPEYPVALRPADVANSGRAPVIVFSEACYGANVFGKLLEQALCLKFLDSGTRVLVASTKIAYGSVSTPLVGADLLGRYFWQNMSAGLAAGPALRRAKLQMAQEMQSRQGFLDGEDQKTLISFVLYGDPLAVAPGRPANKRVKVPPLPKLAATLATVCDRAGSAAAQPQDLDVTSEMVARIKTVVAQYLPGMGDATLRIAPTHAHCHGGDHVCPTAQLSKLGKTRTPPAPRTTVVTLSKQVRSQSRQHPHYARVTLDAQGAVVKIAVSR